MSYSHFTIEERICIKHLLAKKYLFVKLLKKSEDHPVLFFEKLRANIIYRLTSCLRLFLCLNHFVNNFFYCSLRLKTNELGINSSL